MKDMVRDEAAAVSYYRVALSSGMDEDWRKDAFIGLGSSLRCLGHDEEAVSIFRRALEESPDDTALKAFHALALYSMGDARQAVSVLLRLLAETSADERLSSYRRALLFYAENPDPPYEV